MNLLLIKKKKININIYLTNIFYRNKKNIASHKIKTNKKKKSLKNKIKVNYTLL